MSAKIDTFMELLNFFTSDFLYDLARGPMVWISFIIFLIGSIYRTIRFISFTRKKEFPQLFKAPKKKAPKKKAPPKVIDDVVPPPINTFKFTVFGRHPVVLTVSVVFHLILFIAPIFLLAHNILFDEAIGISLCSFPEKITDYMTIIFLVCALFFLLRRIFVSQVRAISSFYDYIILFITVAPFATGLLAYYQIFDYKAVIILHMLAGELMLIAAPFTKIFHMVFFFFGRFVLVNEHTIGRGSRTW